MIKCLLFAGSVVLLADHLNAMGLAKNISRATTRQWSLKQTVLHRLLPAGVISLALLVSDPQAIADDTKSTPLASQEKIEREFHNWFSAWYSNYDAVSKRQSGLTLVLGANYSAYTPTQEGHLRGQFVTSIWKYASEDADWLGYDDFSMRLMFSKGAVVKGSSGKLIPMMNFEGGGSYYEFYQISADAIAAPALRWRTKLFPTRRNIHVVIDAGVGGVVFHPFNPDKWGFTSENWKLVKTYGLRLKTDTITVGDLLGMEKQTVFALIPILPGLRGRFREYRNWDDPDEFYRVLDIIMKLTRSIEISYEYRRRADEDPHKRLMGRVYLFNPF